MNYCFPLPKGRIHSNKILQDKMQIYIPIHRCIRVYIEPN